VTDRSDGDAVHPTSPSDTSARTARRGRDSTAARTPDDSARSSPENAARVIALRLLERQPRTRAELAQAMSRRGVPDEVATVVLDRFSEVGLVDDVAFAQAWVTSRHAGRGLGRRALQAELRRKGVAPEVVEEAVATVSADDEEVAARDLAQRRLRTMTTLARDTQLRRIAGMLARKGFSQGLALRVAADVTARSQAADT
jgi:regulatory protein